MILPGASPLLLLPFFPWWVLPAPEPGLTLLPDPPHFGEELRFIVPGATRAAAIADADTIRVHDVGAAVIASGWIVAGGALWVRLQDDGWVEGSRIDRRPEPLPEDPTPGRERLRSGRVLPWGWRPSDLVQIADSLKAAGFEGKSLRLRRAAAFAFAQMVSAAREDSVSFAAFSAFRPADYQRRLYARAMHSDPAQRSSAPPGRSEHQLGTTVDLSTPNVRPLDPALAESRAGRWLRDHAHEFGFVMTFSKERHDARGVMFEPWHFRWVGELTDDDGDW